MDEILPGVFHWTTWHPKIELFVSSYFLAPERVVLDPMVPREGLDGFPGEPAHVLLTNRHHFRDSARFRERFGCDVRCVEQGLHEFTPAQRVISFQFGDVLPGGIEAIEIGALCPDETALFLARDGGIVAVADGVIRDEGGPLRFVQDDFMGDDPEADKRGLRAAYRRLCEERAFDTLLVAHGLPWVGDAREALRRFVLQP